MRGELAVVDFRFLANVAQVRQSRPDPGLGFPDLAWTFREKVLNPNKLFPLRTWGEVVVGHDEVGAVRIRGEVAVGDDVLDAVLHGLAAYDRRRRPISARDRPRLRVDAR